jgi:hypothetical protein
MADREKSDNIRKLQRAGVALVELPAADAPVMREMQNSVGKDWADGLDRRGKAGSEVLRAFSAALHQ